MRGLRRNDAGPQQSLSARAWDGILVFLFKTVVPLIPIVGIVFVVSYLLNLEITGTYEGTIKNIGAVRLILSEDQERLNGLLVLKANDRYKITEGKMLSDTKMDIVCRKDQADTISAINATGKIAYNTGGDESRKVPEGISNRPSLEQEEKFAGKEIHVSGNKDQNMISGTMTIGAENYNFELQRNSFSAFFGWRWFHRITRAIGFKS